MGRNVFVAGASGAIGRRLCRLLFDDGWTVVGTTRAQAKTAMLRDLGVEPVVVDVFDAPRLLDIVRAAKPEVVVRYGMIYGPGTGFDQPPAGIPLHVDDAADAARRALTRGEAGIYNVAEDNGAVSIKKATDAFGWVAGFRLAER
jgi:nucleoside-diphosphate-sugar epimerase